MQTNRGSMKKGIIVLLITVLAAGMAFAGITGSASLSAGYDLDEKQFTIDNSKTGKGTFTFDFSAESNETAAVESGIYAKFAGSYSANMTEDGLKGELKLDDATIQAVDGLWSVNLTKVANGVELTYAGNALDIYYKNGLNWGVSATSKAFTIVDGLTVKANAGYAVAKNDLADPANYTYGFDTKTAKAIADAKKEAELFAKYPDGMYKDATLRAAQEDIIAAQENVEAKKEAFAKNPSAANKKAIEDAVKYVAYYEAALEEAEAEALAAFQAKTIADGEDWYTAKKSYKYSENWIVKKSTETFDSAKDGVRLIDDEITLPVKSTSYYIVYDSTTTKYTPVEAKDYAPEKGKTVVATVTSKDAGSKVYFVGTNVETIVYKDNEAHYEFASVPGTATVNGGVEIAYAVDKISASVAANVAYETIAKETSYDFTVKGGYDFVNATVKYNSDKVLDAEASVKFDAFVGMPLSAKIGVADILAADEGRVYSGEVAAAVADASLKGTVAVKSVADPGRSKWAFGLEAGYAIEVASFKFSANVWQESGFGADHEYAAAKLAVAPTFEVSNTTLINNASLSLKWAGAQFGGAETNAAKGAVTATIGITF